MDYKKEILKRLVDIKYGNDDFEDVLLDLDSIDSFLDMLSDDTVEEIYENLEIYVQ